MHFLFLMLVIGTCASVSGRRKNVLFITADDLRPELHCYEGRHYPSPVHPTMSTPNIDDLAKRSLLLTRAYVQQAMCSPSRTSFMTGRRPDTTHVYQLDTYFREVGGNFTTIPQYFRMNGYFTAGVGKIFHPGASKNDDPPSWSIPHFYPKKHWEGKEYSWKAVPDKLLRDKPLGDDQVAQKAKETLRLIAVDKKFGGKPFFLAVGFYKPHLPFVFPESFLSYYPESQIGLPSNPYAPDGMPEIAWNLFNELRNYGDQSKLNATGAINTTFPDSNVVALRRAYYSAVSFIDSLIGEVIKELDDLGLGDNTIISFLGDHGWQLGEHGEWCKQTNFELSTHAPLMIHIPGMTDEGIVADEITEFVDLFPTLVEAAGLKPLNLCPRKSNHVRNCREGESLMPLITRLPGFRWKNVAFSQYPRYKYDTKIMGYTVRTDRYRYTEWPQFLYTPHFKPNWDNLFGIELYDHAIDPEENKNRAMDPEYRAVASELRKTLRDGWRAATPNGGQ